MSSWQWNLVKAQSWYFNITSWTTENNFSTTVPHFFSICIVHLSELPFPAWSIHTLPSSLQSNLCSNVLQSNLSRLPNPKQAPCHSPSLSAARFHPPPVQGKLQPHAVLSFHLITPRLLSLLPERKLCEDRSLLYLAFSPWRPQSMACCFNVSINT